MISRSRVHFHNMDGSPALEADIRKHIDKLEQFYAHMVGCEVTVEAPHHHHHKGIRYRVIIKMSVPGDTLVVSQDRGTNPAHENCYVAIHDAFHTARRRLQDYARIRRHDVKHHKTGDDDWQAQAADEIAGETENP